MTKKIANVVSLSGGKDSTALALLAVEQETENLHFVFADTGHEHQQTYDYVEYLDGVLKERCGVGITTVRANFDDRIQKKREFIEAHWKADLMAGKPGVPPLTEAQADDKVARALAVLLPTGNPFLDLCLWKGRFPSTRRRFCSEQLKHVPIMEQAVLPLKDDHAAVISWQGVRRQESAARADLLERDVEIGQWEPSPAGLLIYRPLLDWTADDVFAKHRQHGVRWNPLYEQGMGRVGCMPCIHATKSEMREIARRFPEEVARVAEWERLVSDASKRDCSTFMDARVTAKLLGTGTSAGEIRADTHGIRTYVEWSKTSRGGRQMDLIHAVEAEESEPMCSSIYGLCE